MSKLQSTVIVTPTGRKQIESLVKRKQHERQADFARLRSLYKYGVEEKRIVTLGWEALVASLQRRELTATTVLEAFIAKTLDVCERCNPVTEFVPQAHAWAKELDSLTEVKGPLHGIPFCVKDDTNVIGMDTTHGFGKRLFNPATESAVIIKVLQELGAVPFCKTNVPQGLCSISGNNSVFGNTTNAHNPKLSSGGSSSGTGSLVGAGGALFGTGSDLGGSLRIPAHFNGVSTLKSTACRISTKGLVPPVYPSVVGLDPVVGIIGQTPTIVTQVFRAIVESGRQAVHDATVPPIPWNVVEFGSQTKLRIGYNTSMPFFPTMGDSADTVLRAKAALESLGHTLVEFELPDPYDYMEIFGRILLADKRDFTRMWKGEKITQDSKLIASSTKYPMWLQSLGGKMMKTRVIPAMHSKRLAVFISTPPTKSTDVWDAVADKRRVIEEMLSKWEELELDGLIHNTLPFPAPRTNVIHKLNASMAYTLLWNLVEFPVGVVTLGTESGVKLHDFDDEGDMGFRAVKKVIHESIGSPIGIQVVGKPFQEETVLRIMQELEPFNTFNPVKEGVPL